MCVCVHKALKFGLLDGIVMLRILCISVGFKAQIALVLGAVVRSLFYLCASLSSVPSTTGLYALLALAKYPAAKFIEYLLKPRFSHDAVGSGYA